MILFRFTVLLNFAHRLTDKRIGKKNNMYISAAGMLQIFTSGHL